MSKETEDIERQIRELQSELSVKKTEEFKASMNLDWLVEGSYIKIKDTTPCTNLYMKVSWTKLSNNKLTVSGIGFYDSIGMMFHTTVIESGHCTEEIDNPANVKQLTKEEWVKICEDIKKRIDLRFLS